MVATFTPLLYKHVADRRADIENINRANILLFLQQKTEEYLKDPDNVTALVDELGHNQHKEIFPSELGVGTNFDGRYIIGIRREDEENKPVLKAMIIDTVNTGSDLRAAKVAELIGISAGIYTAVDPDAAWGINGMWSEPLSRYFNTTNIPTGAVAVTTEYNKKKYRVDISDILVDSDLDLGEFELTAEQINAINLAAESGTIDQITTTDARASNKVVAGTKLCLGGEEDDKCIESWEGLGGGGDRSDLALVQLCNAGLSEICALAFMKDLNTSCSKVDAVFDRFRVEYPSPKIYNITYGSVNTYEGYVRTKCEGTSFVVENISTPNLSNPVEQVGDTAFGITTPGWYQITLMGEAGWASGSYGYTWGYSSAGGILIANTYYDNDTLISLKGIKGGVHSTYLGGVGVALWDTINTTGAPILVAGGGISAPAGGGGYIGGSSTYSTPYHGYGWDGKAGGNTSYCDSANCNIGATGGSLRWSYYDNYGGTGYCGSGYTCTTITGGNAPNYPDNYPAAAYGNWGTNTPAGGKGYASIVYCGSSESDCPVACGSDSDCPSDIPYCSDGACTATKACTTDSNCTAASMPYCNNGYCAAPTPCSTDDDCSSVAGKPYCYDGFCSATQCTSNSDCPSSKPYCISNVCSATCTANSQCPSNKPYCNSGTCDSIMAGTTVLSGTGSYKIVAAGKYKMVLRGGVGYYRLYWNTCNSANRYEDTYYGSGGILTASKEFPSGVTLTIGTIRGSDWGWNSGNCWLYGDNMVFWWWGGEGIALWAGTSAPVLAAGGGGAAGRAGGGGFSGGGGSNATGYNWTGATGGSGVSCNGKCMAYGADSGGAGYCESGYTCSASNGANGQNGASATVYYCGPSSSSPCP